MISRNGAKFLAFAVLAIGPSLIQPARAAEPPCKPASVERDSAIALSGSLYNENHFGPPGYGAHPKTDRNDKIAILKLDDPLRIDLPLTEFHAAGIITVKEVQIVPARAGALDAAALSGKHVVIKGKLFEPNGDDHVRDILIFAENGQPGGRVVCGGAAPR